MQENKPYVTICCITYNQAKYIRQTLDGFVAQKTKFPFVAIVGDDCSTDGTREIVKEYAKKYPDIIKPIFQEKNKGGYENFCNVLNAANSKYIALCEGDDYWIDKNKLQIQIDLLDKNEDCNICFHKAFYKFEDKSKKDYQFPKLKTKRLKFNDLLKQNFIQTNSCVYRWQYNNVDIRTIYKGGIMPGDWFLHLLHADKGDILFVDKVMSVYRVNPKGVWFDSYNNREGLFLKYGLEMLKFFKVVKTTFNLDKTYYDFHREMISDIIFAYCINYKMEEMKTIQQDFPEFIEFFKSGFVLKNEKLNTKLKKYRRLYQTLFGVLILLFVITISIFVARGIN